MFCYVKAAAVLAAAVLLCVLFIFCFFRSRYLVIYGLIAALLCMGGFFDLLLQEQEPLLNGTGQTKVKLSALEGEELSGIGEITGIRQTENSVVLTVADIVWCGDYSGENRKKINLVISNGESWSQSLPTEMSTGNSDSLLPGMEVRFSGEFSGYDPATNPGEFDLREYYKSLNILGKVECDREKIEVLSVRSPFRYSLCRLGNLIKERLAAIAEEDDYGILLCLMTGDKSGLTDEVKDMYQEGGIMHLLSLSGLHVSLIGTGTFMVLRRLTGSLLLGSALSGVSVLLFGLLCMGGTSMKRAVICYLFAMAGRILGRQADMLSSAGLCLIFLLLESPLLLFQSGFLMMLCCLAGIGYVLPAVTAVFLQAGDGIGKFAAKEQISSVTGQKIKDQPAIWLKENLQTVVSYLKEALLNAGWLQISSLPAVLWFNGTCPALGALINLLTLPFMGIVLLSAVLAAAGSGLVLSCYDCFGVFSETAADDAGIFLLGPAHYVLSWYRSVLTLFTENPYNLYTAGSPKPWQLILFLTALGIFLYYAWSRLIWQHKGMPWIIGVLILPLSVLLLTRFPSADLEITFVDVGQGDGIVMELPRGRGIVCIDGGSSTNSGLAEYIYEPFLAHEGISKVDCWVLTHPDSDHYSGLLELLEAGFPVTHLMLPEVFRDSELAAQLEALHSVEYIGTGDRFTQGGVDFEVLSPDPDRIPEDTNDGSAVILVQYGEFSALFTGDASTNTDETVLKNLAGRTVNVLKVSHHGSSTGSSGEFLEATSPEVALVSAGEGNRYGHPHEEVVNRLKQLGIPMLNTAETGAIRVFTDGKDYWLRTYR